MENNKNVLLDLFGLEEREVVYQKGGWKVYALDYKAKACIADLIENSNMTEKEDGIKVDFTTKAIVDIFNLCTNIKELAHLKRDVTVKEFEEFYKMIEQGKNVKSVFADIKNVISALIVEQVAISFQNVKAGTAFLNQLTPEQLKAFTEEVKNG